MENIKHLDELMKKHGDKVYTIWTAPDDAVYISRGSEFGNPFAMKDKSENERLRVCVEYENHLREKIKTDEKFREIVKNLKGRNLKCFLFKW